MKTRNSEKIQKTPRKSSNLNQIGKLWKFQESDDVAKTLTLTLNSLFPIFKRNFSISPGNR